MPVRGVRDRDRGWAAMLKNIEEQRGRAFVKVGILGDSARGGLHEKKPDGSAADLTVAEVGLVNEFGTADRRIPERSFVRATFDALAPELHEDARVLLGRVLDGKMTVEQALNVLGLKLASAIRFRIVGGAEIPPTNAPSTRRRKQRAGAWNVRGAERRAGQGVRTLVDTGRMVGAIAWAVVMNGQQRPEQYAGGAGGA